ncbi:programmed cell death protein 2-like isoform X2 [Artemia franciscana]|uniref:programmed cell death protein 2-like isoform X2 n=1 Tax=Artemia franciscana TaxID=6661 RepID=UPI0032DB5028
MTILLGVVDSEISCKEPSDTIGLNKIGGELVLPPDLSKLTQAIETCRKCNEALVLVVQIYAPLDLSVNHRTLAVFYCPLCPSESCYSCWRIEFPDNESNVNKTNAGFASSDWGEEDDWGNSTPFLVEPSTSYEPSTQLANLNISKESSTVEAPELETMEYVLSEPSVDSLSDETDEENQVSLQNELVELVKISALPELLVKKHISVSKIDIQFKPYYISVIDEGENFEIRKYHKKEEEYQERGKRVHESKNEKEISGETYEKAIPVHGDILTHKFLEIVRRSPYQILRYSQDRGKGAALLKEIKGQKWLCRTCGHPAIFELQLMPYLNRCLKAIGKNSLEDVNVQLDFGTILILTCERSCWDSSVPFREEIVIFQPEPLLLCVVEVTWSTSPELQKYVDSLCRDGIFLWLIL